MVAFSGHVLPILAVIAIWFASTGLVAWLGHRRRETFARSLTGAGIVGVLGAVAIAVSAQSASTTAVYASFLGGLAVWGWHEMSFLMGAVTGPQKGPCPADARGFERFARATGVLIHHEIALAITALLLVGLSWSTANPTGAYAFALLFVLRLSSKLNIFVGVPNMSDELLPGHLSYLKSYFGPRRFHPALALSLVGCAALTGWLGATALAATGAAAISTSLLFALAALGTLEHLFLALPFRDGMLWRWAFARTDKLNI